MFPTAPVACAGNSESVTVPAGAEDAGPRYLDKLEDGSCADDAGTPGGDEAPLSTGTGPAIVAVSVEETGLPLSSVMKITFGTAVGLAAPSAGFAGTGETVMVSETGGEMVVVDVVVADLDGAKVSDVSVSEEAEVVGDT